MADSLKRAVDIQEAEPDGRKVERQPAGNRVGLGSELAYRIRVTGPGYRGLDLWHCGVAPRTDDEDAAATCAPIARAASRTRGVSVVLASWLGWGAATERGTEELSAR